MSKSRPERHREARLLATALDAILGKYFFIGPIYSFRITSVAELIEVVIFLGIGVSISILSQARLSLLAFRQQLLASEQDARRTAEDANRLKDEFLSTVSHELRTPLTAINGWALMLRAGRLDATQIDRALETIVRSARSNSPQIPPDTGKAHLAIKESSDARDGMQHSCVDCGNVAA